MNLVLAIGLFSVIYLILAPLKNRSTLILSVVLVLLFLPRPLQRDELMGSPHEGFAPSSPTPYVALAAFGALLIVFAWKRENLPAFGVAAVVVGGLVYGMSAVWAGTPAQWSGVLTWVTALVVWIGTQTVSREEHNRATARRTFTYLVAILVAGEFSIALLQGFGVLEVAASDQGLTRARGTFGHPGDLGKILVAAVAMLLPNLSQSRDQVSRRLTYAAITLSFAAIGLTASRSNLAAIIILIGAWTVLARTDAERRAGRAMLAAGAMACVPFVGTYFLRIRADTRGGSRPELLSAAWEQIAAHPFVGTGPNSYVQVVGQFDAATARGLPVHNAILLAAAELGLPIFALMGAVGVGIVRTARTRRLRNPEDPYPGALLAYLAAVTFMAVTGWGILKITVLPLVVFAGAYLSSGSSASPPPKPEQHPVLERRTKVNAREY